jgi:acyl carrier protein phosphodiesterase
MDYILGKNWDKYCDGDVQSFANKKYEVIGKNINEFPQRVIPIIEKMLNGNFLIKYTTIEGLTFTFEKIQEAARFPSDFIQAIQDLEENYDEIECEFNIFFPEIVLYTKDFRK